MRGSGVTRSVVGVCVGLLGLGLAVPVPAQPPDLRLVEAIRDGDRYAVRALLQEPVGRERPPAGRSDGAPLGGLPERSRDGRTAHRGGRGAGCFERAGRHTALPGVRERKRAGGAGAARGRRHAARGAAEWRDRPDDRGARRQRRRGAGVAGARRRRAGAGGDGRADRPHVGRVAAARGRRRSAAGRGRGRPRAVAASDLWSRRTPPARAARAPWWWSRREASPRCCSPPGAAISRPPELLLAAGADPNDTAPAGTSALVVAAHSGHGALAALLLDAGGRSERRRSRLCAPARGDPARRRQPGTDASGPRGRSECAAPARHPLRPTGQAVLPGHGLDRGEAVLSRGQVRPGRHHAPARGERGGPARRPGGRSDAADGRRRHAHPGFRAGRQGPTGTRDGLGRRWRLPSRRIRIDGA